MSQSEAEKRTYELAALATGKSIEQLHAMARGVFASMLLHAIERPGEIVWTVTRIDPSKPAVEGERLYCEVDFPPRRLELAKPKPKGT